MCLSPFSPILSAVGVVRLIRLSGQLSTSFTYSNIYCLINGLVMRAGLFLSALSVAFIYPASQSLSRRTQLPPQLVSRIASVRCFYFILFQLLAFFTSRGLARL